MHEKIVKSFKRVSFIWFYRHAYFAANAPSGGNPFFTDYRAGFWRKIAHTYTIVDAINDENVLPFRIDYVNTMKTVDGIVDTKVRAIDKERALESPKRIREIVKYTLDPLTKRLSVIVFIHLKGQRMAGFNSIFAVSSIPMAMILC